jgi:hypothetical protein
MIYSDHNRNDIRIRLKFPSPPHSRPKSPVLAGLYAHGNRPGLGKGEVRKSSGQLSVSTQ